MTRRFFASHQGILSHEEEVITAPTEDTGSEAALATVMAEGEAADAEADAAMDEATVTTGLEGVIALENMRLTLSAANESGGMDRFGAMMVKQHADFVLQKFLKAADGLTMPSNESFGGAGKRFDSGVLTMESIGAKAKEIWAAIVKFLKKMRDKVKGWINKLFGAAEKLAKRADAIKARADATKGTPKEKTIENDSVFAALAIDQAVDVAKLKAGMSQVNTIAEEMITNSVANNKAIVDALNIMETVTVDNATAKIAEADKIILNVPVKIGITEGTQLPGNVKMRNQAKTGTGAAERIEGFGLPSNGAKAKTGVKLPTLDLAAIGDLCTVVKSIADSIIATRKVEPESEKAYKKLDEFAAKQTSSSDVADSKVDADKTAHAATIKTFKQLAGTVDGPIKSLSSYCLKTARASLDYCDASLAAY